MPLVPVILLICLTIGIVYFVYIKRKERELIEQVTPITRGERSERRVVLELLKAGINPKAIFHDLYIQKTNGEYTQVDVVVATKKGIIVFEIKDYSGWIFGNEQQRYWTQLLAYGKEKHRFYNPVKQNAGHIQAIRQNLPHNPGIPIYSVIVFFGNSEFKDITCRQEDIFRFVPSVSPISESYRISDRFGYRVHPISGRRAFHAGLDMAAEYAATVHATASGTVSFSGDVPGYGKTVVVTHRFGFKTRYAHLTRIYRHKGAVVVKGEVIGFVGSTGQSTGNHLHYEVIKNDRVINPINFIYGTDE